MQQNPILFVEINETNFIFVVFRYDNNQNLKIIDKLIVNNDVLHKNKLISINEAINLIKKLNWKNGFYRSDIGFKVIDQ